MATLKRPDTVAMELTRAELATLRTGLSHTIMYGTTQEEDRAQALLDDLNADDE
ncbi:hypothetical protein [Streptomyces sp. NPDC060001]|uniref:hypothetical protein n=1 Tax=Streptomyces sp. NPDC060001 TaxID=3347032 RepID=UPI003686CA07